MLGIDGTPNYRFWKSVGLFGLTLFIFIVALFGTKAHAVTYQELTVIQKRTLGLILKKNANWQSRAILPWLNPQQIADTATEYDYILTVLQKPTAQSALELCQYPARFWYVAHINNITLDFQACSELTHFLNEAPANRINLIFADEDFTSPASMLGHVFLTLEGLDKNNILRKNNVSFIMPLDGQNYLGILLSYFRAVTLGKTGIVVLKPFTKDRDYYIYTENRNIWEIQLTTEPDRIKLLQLMIWELHHSQMVYHFFTYNCASFVELMMELSDPNFDPGILFTTPLRVIKSAEANNQISEITLYPNLHWQKNIGEHTVIAPKASPLYNMKESQFFLGVGGNSRQPSLDIGYAAIAHEPMDRVNILSHNSSLILGGLNLNYQIDARKLTVENATLIRIGNLSPFQEFQRPSFLFNLSYDQQPDKYLNEIGVFQTEYRIGVTWQLHSDIQFYALMGAGGLTAQRLNSVNGLVNSGVIINQIYQSKSILDYVGSLYSDKSIENIQTIKYSLQFNGSDDHNFGVSLAELIAPQNQATKAQIYYKYRF